MISHVNEKRKAALILLIDFKKAFDSIDHKFIDNSLKLFGFGTNVRSWISTFFREHRSLNKSHSDYNNIQGLSE